jgi:hypothetical protein
MNSLQKNAFDLIKSLPDSKLAIAIDYLSYLKDKDEWEATNELSDSHILKEIQAGIEDLKAGRVVDFEEIRRNV